jgi:L-gulono-1,4-lactone dehydrogenase
MRSRRHTARVATWRNWAGNQHAEPRSIEHPRDVEEVSLLVKRAAGEKRRVKAVGSGHSFTPAAVTDGTLLRLDRLSGLISSDLATGLVTVHAGTPLHQLNALLADLGLAMSNLGDIDRQTVSGATSTGTHGTGSRLGGLATQIRGLELVVGDGSIVQCSADQRPELFECARVGLGALGIVTAMTLQCEPAFLLEADEQPMPLDRVMADLDELTQANDHFEFYWFPHTDIALTKRNNRLAPGQEARPLKRWREWLEDEFLANTLFNAVCALGKARPSLVPRLNGTAAKMLGPRRFSAASHEVFTSPRRVRFVEMEYAVPRGAIRDAVEAVQRVIDRDNLQISFPIEVRVTAPDNIPLSTASGRDSAYVAIHRYRGEPFEGYFRAVEREMRALEGRPHWGKMHWRTHEDLRPAYPRFDDFLAVRDSVDPDRVFANYYLETVLGR